MKISECVDMVTGLTPATARVDPPPPRSVKIELTARCNFACSFCARARRLRDQRDMDRALFERLASEMRAAGVAELGVFYLGESFLCDWLAEAIRFAKRIAKYERVFLTTNGSLATPDRVEACMRAGLDSLKFSLNYADEAQFVEVARVKPVLFRDLIANAKAARAIRDRVVEDAGHRCALAGSYIAYDGEQGTRMRATIAELAPYLDEIYALPLYNQADLVGADETARGWAVSAGNRGRADALRAPLPCWSIFTEGHVTWDGKLAACCFDHDGRFEMGDLTKESFLAAWRGARFQALRRAHLGLNVAGTACERCVAYQ